MEMLDYIREQPLLFAQVLEDRLAAAAPFCRVCKAVQPTRIALIASGTSRNAALAAAPFMEWVLGIEVTVQAPSQVQRLHGGRTLAIVISQGGNSTNSLAVFDRLEGVPTIAMTGNPYGHLNKKGDHYIAIPCGEELAGPKTKGYTITILTLYLLALEYAHQSGRADAAQYGGCLAALRAAAAAQAGNIQAAEEWVSANQESLKHLRTVYLVGKKQGMQVAAEGALKLMETLLIPAFSFDFEEFLHGPASSLGETVSGIYLLPPPADADYERMQRLVQYHRGVCPAVYTVGLCGGRDGRDCPVKAAGQWYTQPFEQILPMQLISAVIPPLLGIGEVGFERFLRLDAIMNIKQKNARGML